jgi:hypothetical protein
LKNRSSNYGKFFDDNVKQQLARFFKNHELLARPQATKVVRELTGSGLREGEEGVIELPPSFLKRGMFARFISDRDYKVVDNPRGGIQANKKRVNYLHHNRFVAGSNSDKYESKIIHFFDQWYVCMF